MKQQFRFLFLSLFLAAATAGNVMSQSLSQSTNWHWDKGTILIDTPSRPEGQQHAVGLTAPRLSTVRVGFVGLGMRGPGAVNRWTHIPGVQIVALCDYEEERAEACQRYLRKAGLPPAVIYSGATGYEELCQRADIDLVYVATDWEHHFPVAKCALENGKHTAVEVPSCMNLDQCWELINLSEKTRKHCMILENCCYDWYEMTALNMAQQGVFGEVIRGEGAYIHNLQPFWDAYWKNPDGSDRWGNVYRFHVQESSDNGKTWSKPRDITKDISFPEWPFGKGHNAGGFIFISSGSGIQTKDGTLLHTLVHVGDGNALFGTPDHGKTWKAYGKPVKKGDECKVVELTDGSWMINSRWHGGGRQIHVSKDRGMTWESRYDKTLEDPQCNAQIMRYGEKLLFSNCKSPKRRALLHLRVSKDDGATWNDGLCVESQGAGYSDMAILPSGDIGVIYEGAGYNTIIFTTVPASSL